MKRLAMDLRWIDSSGVGTYIQGMMPGLVSRLSGVEITGIGDCGRLREFAWASAGNVRLVECGAGRYSMAEQWELLRAIPRETDLFFSPYYTYPLLYPYLFKGRLAVTVHDMSHRVVEEIVGNAKKRVYAQVMFGELRRRADVIFTVSEFSRGELLRLTRGGRENNVVVTHLGIAPEWYGAAKLPPVRSRPYLIAVGNVKPYKNLRRMVEAFLQVKDQVEQDLVIVGQHAGLITGEGPEFFRLIEGSSGRVSLTGFVSDAELMALVGHADALVMPSTYEGFGLPPLEAMAAGTPVIVSKVASLPEVCEAAARYFDPLNVQEMAEAIRDVALNSEKRDAMRKTGIEQSQQFVWDKCSRLTAEALGQIL